MSAKILRADGGAYPDCDVSSDAFVVSMLGYRSCRMSLSSLTTTSEQEPTENPESLREAELEKLALLLLGFKLRWSWEGSRSYH